ncbi:hypothetical protein M426DRAFT_257724 [Hypoxylon sp. CI-4A]|nr:hypothetical protein M426DRAFT_257724 [Hypoxylon sp. CI-4A]
MAHYGECLYPPQPRHDSQQLNHEDGFNEDIENRLKTRGANRIDEWVGLYRLLFPDDNDVPEPEFVPVVEDHEVILKYEHTRLSLTQHVNDFITRQALNSTGDIERLTGDIMDLISRNLFERQMSNRHDPRNTQSPFDQSYQSTDNGFIEVVNEGTDMEVESSSPDRLTGMTYTPQHMSPDTTAGETGDPLEELLGNPQTVGIASMDQNLQMEPFRQPFASELNNPFQTDQQSYSPYDGYIGAGILPLEFWVNRNHHSLSTSGWQSGPLSRSMLVPGVDNTGEDDSFWIPGIDYQYEAANDSRDTDPDSHIF